jgi:hypothetical protein
MGYYPLLVLIQSRHLVRFRLALDPPVAAHRALRPLGPDGKVLAGDGAVGVAFQYVRVLKVVDREVARKARPADEARGRQEARDGKILWPLILSRRRGRMRTK